MLVLRHNIALSINVGLYTGHMTMFAVCAYWRRYGPVTSTVVIRKCDGACARVY